MCAAKHDAGAVPRTGAVLRGTPVVPGVGHGPVVRPGPAPGVPDDESVPRDAPDARMSRFACAAEAVATRLEELSHNTTGAAAEVLVATAGLARDSGLAAFVSKRVYAGSGASAATAGAVAELSDMFRATGGIMAERVTDLVDVRDRIIARLTGQPEPGMPVPDVPSVLLAYDLAPADTAGLDPSLVLAIATELGGPTSHTAIIARQLGIPCVVAVPGLAKLPAGTSVLVDGSTGEVVPEPDPKLARERTVTAAALRQAAASWRGPGATRDGHRVEILANVQDGAGARRAAAMPVEGVGLFRTELCFLGSDGEPGVERQAQAYAEVFAAMGERKVVIRTLDAGSDKPLSFVTTPDEPNPALGIRGLRIAREHPGILQRQLDAIALAAEDAASGPVWVMAPMVSTVAEAKAFGALVRDRGLVAGAMVEVPSAALQAPGLMRHLDFVSLGTNDLSQYALAADRMTPALSDLTDPWQPALLQLVAMTAAAGRAAGKPVGVCGESAADPLLGCVLVGLGATSLSSAGTAAPAVGAQLSKVDLAQCEAAAAAVLDTDDPADARAAARAVLL
ncbi:MAG: PEP-utilizing enzyme [Actinomycetota bacterium]|nr:PEP-utilizing enzyme [Actinomycetota bacterium]